MAGQYNDSVTVTLTSLLELVAGAQVEAAAAGVAVVVVAAGMVLLDQFPLCFLPGRHLVPVYTQAVAHL